MRNKSRPKISVIVPCLNNVRFIDKTLNSIVKQTYQNFEVIIQDGGSKDGTLDVIKKFAREYPSKINWVSKKDNGQVDAINKGIARAKGEIITYINSDDLYYSNTFGKVAAAYQKTPDSFWFAGKGIVVDQNEKKVFSLITFYKNILFTINSYYLLLIVNYLMQPSVFITKKAVKRFGKFYGNKKYVLEYDFWLKVGKKQMPLLIKETLSKFRISGDNITSTNFEALLDDDFRIVRGYTKNQIILFFHWIHNLARKLVIKTR